MPSTPRCSTLSTPCSGAPPRSGTRAARPSTAAPPAGPSILPVPDSLPFPHVNQVWLIERYVTGSNGKTVRRATRRHQLPRRGYRPGPSSPRSTVIPSTSRRRPSWSRAHQPMPRVRRCRLASVERAVPPTDTRRERIEHHLHEVMLESRRRPDLPRRAHICWPTEAISTTFVHRLARVHSAEQRCRPGRSRYLWSSA